MPVAVTVFTLSVGAWQCSNAPSGAGIVCDALIISMLIVLQKQHFVLLSVHQSVLLQSSKQSYVKVAQ